MIDLSETKPLSSGASGRYYRWDKNTGLKLTALAKAEGAWLKWLNKKFPGEWPQFKKFVFVSVFGQKELGYLMEHIEGRNAYGAKTPENWADAPCRWYNPPLVRKLGRYDLLWRDNGPHNTILTPGGKFRPIDADPRMFYRMQTGESVYK